MNPTKDWLNNGREMYKAILKKKRRIEALEEMSLNISPHIDTVGGYRSKDRLVKVNYSDRKVDEEAKLFAMEERHKAVIVEIQDAIDLVDDDVYKTVLELRYVMFESWEVIAHKIGYTKRNIYRVHDKAVDLAETVLFRLGKFG